MAQGAGASDPEPRALRGAATAPRVTSGPRGRAQAEADRARTPPGRPLQLSARRLGRQKLCVWGTEAPVARGRSRLALLPRTGVAPGRALAGRALCPARTEGSVPPALRRGDLREHRPAAASRPLCVWTPFDIGPAPHGVSEFRLRRNASGKSLCVRRLRWETRHVRSAVPAATSGPVLVRPELSSVLPDVSRIPRPSVRRRRELHTCGNHSVSVLATGLHHRAPSSSVRTCRSGSEWPSWLGLKPPRPPWQGARAGRKPQLRGPGRAQASGPASLSFTRPPPGERRPRGRPGHAGPEALSPPPAPRGPRVCCEASAFLFLFFFSVGRTGWWAASLTGP